MSNTITSNEHFLKRARNIRNELLNKTDRYILEDYPLTEEEKEVVKDYRKKLRDFINENKDKILSEGQTPDFPIQPKFVNINILY
jgi:hypothetical protein